MTYDTIDNCLYFPFTHISQNDLDTLLTFFAQFHSLSINKEKSDNGNHLDSKQNSRLNQLIENKKILPYFVPSKIIAAVEHKFVQYMEWVKINKGNEHNLKLLLKNNPYFTSDSDVTAIKSHLKGDEKGEFGLLSDNASFENDLLFLKMAQSYDEQHEGIDLELKNLDKSSEELVSILRGVEDSENKTKPAEYDKNMDSGTMMVKERISAWFRSLNTLKKLRADDSTSLFVTTSEMVFNHLESNCSNVVNILDVDDLKVHDEKCENRAIWQNQFKDNLIAGIAQRDGTKDDKNNDKGTELLGVSDQCSKRAKIKVCNFSGGEINQIINKPDGQIFVCLIKLK